MLAFVLGLNLADHVPAFFLRSHWPPAIGRLVAAADLEFLQLSSPERVSCIQLHPLLDWPGLVKIALAAAVAPLHLLTLSRRIHLIQVEASCLHDGVNYPPDSHGSEFAVHAWALAAEREEPFHQLDTQCSPFLLMDATEGLAKDALYFVALPLVGHMKGGKMMNSQLHTLHCFVREAASWSGALGNTACPVCFPLAWVAQMESFAKCDLEGFHSTSLELIWFVLEAGSAHPEMQHCLQDEHMLPHGMHQAWHQPSCQNGRAPAVPIHHALSLGIARASCESLYALICRAMICDSFLFDHFLLAFQTDGACRLDVAAEMRAWRLFACDNPCLLHRSHSKNLLGRAFRDDRLFLLL